jgi:hypothetical protein
MEFTSHRGSDSRWLIPRPFDASGRVRTSWSRRRCRVREHPAVRIQIFVSVEGFLLDNEKRHRDNGVCADNEVFGWNFPPGAFFFFTARFEDMTKKITDSKPANGAAKRKTAKAVSKPASPRTRTRKKEIVPPDEEIEMTAYFLWESRGHPMGSPEADWHEAKEKLRQERSS